MISMRSKVPPSSSSSSTLSLLSFGSLACSSCISSRASAMSASIFFLPISALSTFSLTSSSTSISHAGFSVPRPPPLSPVDMASTVLLDRSLAAASVLMPGGVLMPIDWVMPSFSADFIASLTALGSDIICISSGFSIIRWASFWNLGLAMMANMLPLLFSSISWISSMAPGSSSRMSAIIWNIGLPCSALSTSLLGPGESSEARDTLVTLSMLSSALTMASMSASSLVSEKAAVWLPARAFSMLPTGVESVKDPELCSSASRIISSMPSCSAFTLMPSPSSASSSLSFPSG
mmetsp:Transcript_66930/g.165088  ORF Transcript_66930/g.165088 Transcript_66930/m.165088 type:complete len:292 (-) Transcript_66930:852-1727(-)